MLPAYPLVLAINSNNGAALTNTVTPTSILHGSGIGTLGGGWLQVGSKIKGLVRGRVSTLVTTPGTLTFDIRFGSIVVSAFGAIALNIVAQTNAFFDLEFLIDVVSIGGTTSATALCTGRFVSRALLGSVAAASGGVGVMGLPDTAPVVGTGFDSTIAIPVNLFATWSVASASNSIQVHSSLIEFKV